MPDAELTEEQLSRYDRQIRLWGVEAQRKLMAMAVCVLHVDAISMEVAKNLAAAGVNLTLVDERPYEGQLVSVVPMEDMFAPMSSVSTWFAKSLRRMNDIIALRTAAAPPSDCNWFVGSVQCHDLLYVASNPFIALLYEVTAAKVKIFVAASKEDLSEMAPTFATGPQGALAPSEAAVIGGLIAQYVTRAAKREEQPPEDFWNLMEYDRERMSARVSVAACAAARCATATATAAAQPSAPLATLDIDD